MERVIYSFIIPHKNCPDLLKRCVDSIPAREDVQIIIVDDNSDADKRPSIDRSDVEIILINAEQSKGAGRARNVGLAHAKGEWLLFADADDYYDINNLCFLLDRFRDDTTTDIVYMNAQLFDENGVFRKHPIECLINNYLNNKDQSEMHLRYGVWTPWTRMIRKNIVKEHDIRFEEVPAANDKNFCLECSRYAKVVKVEINVVYNYYRPHFHSETDKLRNSKGLDSMIMVRSHTNKIYTEVGYKHQLSYFELFHKSKYSRDLSFAECFRKYLLTLKNNDVCLIQDLYRFYKTKRFLVF